MKKVEEIILEQKEKTDLTNVTFVPPKFGVFIISSILFGIGIGMISFKFGFAIGPLLVGLFGMAYSFGSRGEW